jgi:hypothetical protein
MNELKDRDVDSLFLEFRCAFVLGQYSAARSKKKPVHTLPLIK